MLFPLNFTVTFFFNVINNVAVAEQKFGATGVQKEQRLWNEKKVKNSVFRMKNDFQNLINGKI